MKGSRRVSRLKARNEASAAAAATVAMKAAGYIRVSTEEQVAHGHGLDSQTRAIKAFAESQGYELVAVEGDPGISGATRPADREGFRRLIELGAAGAFAVLLVWKFDRLARQIVYAVTAVNELAGAGIVIRSVTEPIDTATPMGRTIFAVLAGMAEQERQAITERTHAGRREKATKGGFAGGAAPFGYERDRDGGLTQKSTAAAVVRRIFEMRAAPMTLRAIADQLNAEGIPSARGGRWHSARVGYILDNPKYSGGLEYLFRWGGTETHVLKRGKHKAIV